MEKISTCFILEISEVNKVYGSFYDQKVDTFHSCHRPNAGYNFMQCETDPVWRMRNRIQIVTQFFSYWRLHLW